MKILLIEDEIKAVETLKKGFIENHFQVDVAYDGEVGFNLATSTEYDVIVSDVVIPKLNGFDLVKKIRDTGNSIPILLLTALIGTDNTVVGLDCGADDYLTKPFEFKELMARVKALARRSQSGKRQPAVLTYADIIMDVDSKKVMRAGIKIDLTPKEFALLMYFINNQGRVIPKSEITEKVWDIDFDISTNVIEVYINYLRNKIDKPFSNKLIHTVFGSGYIFKEEK